MKKITAITVSVLAALSLCACGSSSYDSDFAFSNSKAAYMEEAPAAATESYAYDGFAEEAPYENANGSFEESDSTRFDDSARKLIKTYNLSIETENFDNLLSSIDDKINELRGYVQELNTSNGSSFYGTNYSRRCNMTVRIPSKNLEDFVAFVGEASNITDKSLSVEDVTLDYVDTNSRKEAYEVEQERLLALLDKAESMEDIITIESRLSEVRYHLETMESQLRTYDNLVDYATVYIYISEVEVYTAPEPETYGEKLLSSFTRGFENVKEGLSNFLVNLVGALPGIVVFVVVVVIVLLVISGLRKASSKKRIKKEKERSEKLMAQAIETAKNKAKEN